MADRITEWRRTAADIGPDLRNVTYPWLRDSTKEAASVAARGATTIAKVSLRKLVEQPQVGRTIDASGELIDRTREGISELRNTARNLSGLALVKAFSKSTDVHAHVDNQEPEYHISGFPLLGTPPETPATGNNNTPAREAKPPVEAPTPYGVGPIDWLDIK